MEDRMGRAGPDWQVARALLGRALPMAGLHLRRLERPVRGAPHFVAHDRDFRQQSPRAGLPAPAMRDLFPISGEDTEAAGGYDAHYLSPDFWAARRVFDTR